MKLIKESDYLLLWLVAAVLAAALLLHKAQMFHLTNNTVNLSMSGAGHSLCTAAAALGLGCPGPGVRAALQAVLLCFPALSY